MFGERETNSLGGKWVTYMGFWVILLQGYVRTHLKALQWKLFLKTRHLVCGMAELCPLISPWETELAFEYWKLKELTALAWSFVFPALFPWGAGEGRVGLIEWVLLRAKEKSPAFSLPSIWSWPCWRVWGGYRPWAFSTRAPVNGFRSHLAFDSLLGSRRENNLKCLTNLKYLFEDPE